jgi:hypothetical protein
VEVACGVLYGGEEKGKLIGVSIGDLSTCLGLQDAYSLDETVLYKNNPQVSIPRILPCSSSTTKLTPTDPS